MHGLFDGAEYLHIYGILYSNARSHWQWEILEHPLYSPDMIPSNYDLFVKVKEPLRGNYYGIMEISKLSPSVP